MPSIVFTSNESDIPQLEGLYVKERTPPAAIAGANFSQVSIVGETIRGPVDRAVLITSEARFEEVFGGRDQGSGGAITNKVWLALLNKPFGLVSVTRVAAAAGATATIGLTGATVATGTIQDVSKANHVDGEYVQVSDGVTARVFEYDVAGDGVTGGRTAVNISGATSAADVANALVSAINGTGQTLIATANSSGLVSISNTVAGTAGNVIISTTVANGGYAVTGMSGGTASGTPLLTVTATSKGIWGNNVTVTTAAASDGNAAHFNLTATYLGKSYVYKNLDISTVTSDNTLSTLGTDDGNVITLTKVAAGRPAIVSAKALAGGSEGTVADSDYTASGRGINVAAVAPGCGVVMCAEKQDSSIKALMYTLTSSVSDRVFVIGADSETVSASTANTEAASYRSDRMIYAFNHAYTLDPSTATEVLTSPVSWMASILSQVDVDINPGEEDSKQFTKGITRLYNTGYLRNDYIAFKNAGIAAMENDQGFAFVSGITTSVTPGKEQISRRRSADFINVSLSQALKFNVKKKLTATRKEAISSETEGFLDDLKQQERVVLLFNVDPDKLNTANQLALGIFRLLVRVKLIGHILELVLETEVGDTVNIVEA